MYEDRLMETIMSEMMSDFKSGIRTDEGSLAYNACAKIGSALEETYADMDEINDNMLPDTQDLEHLIRYAKERGVIYNYATAPVVKGIFNQEIELGESFTCNDYTYIVIKNIDENIYELRCETEGTEANGNFGELIPVDYIDNYLGGEITEIISAGTDDEDEEIFRQRVMDSFQSKAFGGNKADYRSFVNLISGVGGCKPKRRAADSPYIYITVISSDFSKPSDDLIKKIQENVDPEESHGEGDGMAPICHSVIIKAAEPESININTNITFDSGYDAESMQDIIEQSIDEYMLSLRQTWESNEFSDTIVRISQIEAKILSIEGILDVKDTTLNGDAVNVNVDYEHIPVRGDVHVI